MIPLMKNAFLNEFETKKALADFILKTERLSMDMKCSEFEKTFSKKTRTPRRHFI
jgi:CDP-6-deoxy-D-xylo-4-hexulose-3-dehydrase